MKHRTRKYSKKRTINYSKKRRHRKRKHGKRSVKKYRRGRQKIGGDVAYPVSRMVLGAIVRWGNIRNRFSKKSKSKKKEMSLK